MRIPYYKQETEWTCGAACMRMALASLGKKYSEKQLAKLLRTTKKHGARRKYLVQLAEHFQLSYVASRNATLADIASLLKQQYRVIVCFMHNQEESHYAVVSRLTKTHIHLLDPLDGPNMRYTRSLFNRIWHDDIADDPARHWLLGIKA